MFDLVTPNLFNIGDKVSLPFSEKGIIVNITTTWYDWFPYKVKITEGDGIFHKVGDIEEYKESDIKRI